MTHQPNINIIWLVIAVGGVCSLVVAFIVFVTRSTRRRPEIGRLREQFEAAPAISDSEWVWAVGPAAAQVRLSGHSAFYANLLIAFTPQGMCLKLREPYSPLGNLPAIRIPWQFVKCVAKSKFGFFRADFTVTGFDDGQTIGIEIHSTNQEMGRFIAQCATAANGI